MREQPVKKLGLDPGGNQVNFIHYYDNNYDTTIIILLLL